jgi:hypothetical protein
MALTFSIRFPFFMKYHELLKISAIFQIFILLLSALVLDEGEMCRFMSFAAGVYWIMVAIIMIRRDGRATISDRVLVIAGFFIAMILIPAVGAVVPIGLLRH